MEERRAARGRVGQGATAGGRSVARDGRRRGGGGSWEWLDVQDEGARGVLCCQHARWSEARGGERRRGWLWLTDGLGASVLYFF